MTAKIRERVEAVCGELIQKHLDLLLLLMAEEGMSSEQQRARMDVLVRCLTSSQIEDTIFEQGRRVPLSLDTHTSPPTLRLNAELLERVDDDELLSAFTRPISELLGVPAINAGLVLQGRDEKQLRNLYHSARGKLTTPVINAASVRSVIEWRVMLFAERLRNLVRELSDQRLQLPAAASFIGWLESQRGSWPDWIDVAVEDFTTQTVQAVTEALADTRGLPPAENIVELCWESLNLSPQSFMRHAARGLRTQELPVNEELLRAIAGVMAPRRVAQLESLEQWHTLADLQGAWRELVELELETLGPHHHGQREIPEVSVFAAPRDSMSLREPEDLPWGYPLLCWSLREHNALRDLLHGFVRTQRVNEGEESEFELLLVEEPEPGHEPPLATDGPRRRVDMQVVGTTLDVPPGYDIMRQRAWDATLARLTKQLANLNESMRNSALNRIRGAYDGFFMGTRHVWERRLQGWRLDPLPESTQRLAAGVADLLDCPVIFDPFESPASDQMRMMPTFCFIVAISPHLEKVPFRVPISVLTMTAATGTPPLRVRMVEVPGSPNEPCKWLCDLELTMENMHGQPVNVTLNAVEDNMLRMIAFE